MNVACAARVVRDTLILICVRAEVLIWFKNE
nr:MAG TPA: hypothetical protein [Caudoviricetes sp.]